MAPLISLIIIFILSMLITRIATEALVHTGLSRQSAKFQARSAFTGVGFTTSESESIVKNPARRRIILSLMLIGNVGIISAVASLMLTFVDSKQGALDDIWRIVIIVGSLFLFWQLSKSKYLEKIIVRMVNKALEKFSEIKVTDYVELLNLTGEYEITVLKVKEGDWLENKELNDVKINKEGVNLIAVRRKDNTFIGTPQGDTKILEGDNLIMYGREKNLKNLEKRKNDPRGKAEHEKAVKDQEKELQRQETKDRKGR